MTTGRINQVTILAPDAIFFKTRNRLQPRERLELNSCPKAGTNAVVRPSPAPMIDECQRKTLRSDQIAPTIALRKRASTPEGPPRSLELGEHWGIGFPRRCRPAADHEPRRARLSGSAQHRRSHGGRASEVSDAEP